MLPKHPLLRYLLAHRECSPGVLPAGRATELIAGEGENDSSTAGVPQHMLIDRGPQKCVTKSAGSPGARTQSARSYGRSVRLADSVITAAIAAAQSARSPINSLQTSRLLDCCLKFPAKYCQAIRRGSDLWILDPTLNVDSRG